MDESVIERHVREMVHHFRKQERLCPAPDIADLSLAQAYSVQNGFVADRLRTQGKIVGWKVGCTSAAIRSQFGLSQPISGRLFEKEISRDGAELPISGYVDAAMEAELYFRLGHDLEGEVSDAQITQAIAGVGPGIEMHNYRFCYGKPTSQELIASNGLHAGFVMGREKAWSPESKVHCEEVAVVVNGEARAVARCTEIMGGGPLGSLKWLVHHAAERGQRLLAGEIVIPGSAASLVRVGVGDRIEARFSGLGSCHARMI